MKLPLAAVGQVVRPISTSSMVQVTLDCTSVETASASVAALLRRSVPELLDALRECVIDWESLESPEQQLTSHLGYRDSAHLPQPTRTKWFHATRASRTTKFSDGLLPTLAALPRLWSDLGNVAACWTTPDEWRAYQKSFETADRYFAQQFRRKRIAPGWEGPFAFLVRDAALGLHNGHKDFTKIAESLEDICADYEEVFGYPLRQTYELATSPCLVVFTQPGPWPGSVRAALNYVHRTVHSLSHGHDSNTCFSGEGHSVPPSWIDAVEWLEPA